MPQKHKDNFNDMYCKFRFISMTKELWESKAWNSLTLAQIRVFIYLWSCLQWNRADKKKKKASYPRNNGDIEVSSVKMGKELDISKTTCSKAVHKLIEVGLIRLTRVGENKVCHKYRILYEVVASFEERWRNYPQQNWKKECPKSPNTLIGLKTRFPHKDKSHPNLVDLKSSNQSNGVDLRCSISQVELTVNKDIEE